MSPHQWNKYHCLKSQPSSMTPNPLTLLCFLLSPQNLPFSNKNNLQFYIYYIPISSKIQTTQSLWVLFLGISWDLEQCMAHSRHSKNVLDGWICVASQRYSQTLHFLYYSNSLYRPLFYSFYPDLLLFMYLSFPLLSHDLLGHFLYVYFQKLTQPVI